MKRTTWWLLAALCCASACGDDDDGTPDASADGGDAGQDSGRDGGEEPMPDASMDAAVDAAIDSGMDGGMTGGNVARGEYLVAHVAACGDCHTPRNPDGSFQEDKLLSGVECFIDAVPNDPNVGCLSSRNLTNHETGLKNRSDEEIKDMFMKGLRPDGKALHPVMPYYVLGNMTEEDADAIVAYLRTLPGVDHMLPPSQPPFLVDEPAPLWPEAKIPKPRSNYSNQAAAMRGRYLAGNIGVCMECHTARNDQGQVLIDNAFEGGNTFGRADLGLPPIFPETIYSSNLTPHATGIADYTVDDIVRVLKQGQDPNQGNAPICPPMPSGPMGAFGGLTDQDARDIAHYLLSIPPRENMIPNDCVAMPPDGDAGTEDAG